MKLPAPAEFKHMYDEIKAHPQGQEFIKSCYRAITDSKKAARLVGTHDVNAEPVLSVIGIDPNTFEKLQVAGIDRTDQSMLGPEGTEFRQTVLSGLDQGKYPNTAEFVDDLAGVRNEQRAAMSLAASHASQGIGGVGVQEEVATNPFDLIVTIIQDVIAETERGMGREGYSPSGDSAYGGSPQPAHDYREVVGADYESGDDFGTYLTDDEEFEMGERHDDVGADFGGRTSQALTGQALTGASYDKSPFKGVRFSEDVEVQGTLVSSGRRSYKTENVQYSDARLGESVQLSSERKDQGWGSTEYQDRGGEGMVRPVEVKTPSPSPRDASAQQVSAAQHGHEFC